MCPHQSSTLIPGVTGPGVQTATVTITITNRNPVQKSLSPPPGTPVEISFLHNGPGAPTHGRPHGIEWVAANLQGNERIEVRIDTRFPGYENHQPMPGLESWCEQLEKLFPSAFTLPSGAFGWELTAQEPNMNSGVAKVRKPFKLKKNQAGRPLIHYEIAFYDRQGAEHVIDPDVDIEPDP